MNPVNNSGNRKPRIAHLIISNAWGGAENVAFNIARHLAGKTYQYIIVNQEIVDHFLPLGDEGVGVFSIGRIYDCGAMMRPWRYLRACGRIKKILVTEGIDIVHFHLVWGIIAYYPMFGKRGKDRSTAITLHGEVRTAHLHIRNRIERFVLWRALGKHIDAVVSCSGELTDYLKKEGVYRLDITTVIHNGINEMEWENVEPVVFPGDGEKVPAPFRLLFVGNLRPEKGMDLLVEAIHRIYAERRSGISEQSGKGSSEEPSSEVRLSSHEAPSAEHRKSTKCLLRQNSTSSAAGAESQREIEAHIIGTGQMMPRLERMVKEYGLEERVDLMGFVEKENMYGYYRSCDALASFCDWEGCSIVLLEAMAAGLPVIATAVGGTPEIIENGRNGFLVKRDAEAIKAAILKAAAAPDLLAEMRRNNLKDVRDFYWRNIVKKYLEIYERIDKRT